MSITLIAGKLARMGLIDTDGDGVSLTMTGPLLFLSDGSTGFYTDPRAAWQGIKALDQCSPGQFWDREWLKAPAYDSLAGVWDSLDTPQIEAADKPPRASDYVAIGRLRRFGAKEYIIQTENGEYGVVDEKQASKWRLTPLD
jgi:hypothetical protein